MTGTRTARDTRGEGGPLSSAPAVRPLLSLLASVAIHLLPCNPAVVEALEECSTLDTGLGSCLPALPLGHAKEVVCVLKR